MLTLSLFGLAFAMACISASSPIYQFLTISLIISTYFILLDKDK